VVLQNLSTSLNLGQLEPSWLFSEVSRGASPLLVTMTWAHTSHSVPFTSACPRTQAALWEYRGRGACRRTTCARSAFSC